MYTKLTLSLNKSVIERAKKYARKEKKSLSRLAEDYFTKLSSSGEDQPAFSPLVKKLSGVIKNDPSDHKKKYEDFLSKKYIH